MQWHGAFACHSQAASAQHASHRRASAVVNPQYASFTLLMLWRVASPFRVVHEELCSIGARDKELVIADAKIFQGGFCLLKIMHRKGCSQT